MIDSEKIYTDVTSMLQSVYDDQISTAVQTKYWPSMEKK